MNKNETGKPQADPKGLLPILLFLVLYLGNGIYFEYIRPTEGQMGFYVVSVVLAFSIALIAAFLQNRTKTFDEKISICAKGIGDDNIVIMLFIFLMAGAFSGIAKEAGGAASTANGGRVQRHREGGGRRGQHREPAPEHHTGAVRRTGPVRDRLPDLDGDGNQRGNDLGAHPDRVRGLAKRRPSGPAVRRHRRRRRDVRRQPLLHLGHDDRGD